ncbi:unnamed protein product [Diatraea saccharalis]|uniref:Iron hydrogenase large subunit C-terminal domain-containing protein n=1 Tax=Diatraea saccharalis TaxID=40085 RepID=A0A9N9QU87_9NEOP|nr:unnamed protein product [Diatraea saccharalis]
MHLSGWVCYAEKTHGSFILPHISTTKSPQQIMGSLVKQLLSESRGVIPGEVYHVTVMPCYDKKLEASREDFYSELLNCHDVDCVITAIEIEQMLGNSNMSLSEAADGELENPWGTEEDGTPPSIKRHIGSGSGGYADHVFLYAAEHLFGETNARLVYKNLRNPDFREVTLEKDGKEVLRFAIANGFRNIQNLVQKLKRGKSPYHYVEVMACPSGCLNGGAQVRSATAEGGRELVRALEAAHERLPLAPPPRAARALYARALHGHHSDKARALLHTAYHAVDKTDLTLNIKW